MTRSLTSSSIAATSSSPRQRPSMTFFKQRLTMNTTAATASQGQNFSGSTSSINLRGLGTNQTLVLVDGRRLADINLNGQMGQPDLNGIPLAAIERIEVLPTTASGIYGGSATGGVINIILRRDYSGGESKLTYANTFDSKAAIRRVDQSVGFTLEEGKTNILIAGSYSDQTPLLLRDRDLYQRGEAAILANNNNSYSALNTLGVVPPLGATPTITSIDGSNLTLKSGAALNSPITYVPVGYPGAAS